jgi:hypothetical protein
LVGATGLFGGLGVVGVCVRSCVWKEREKGGGTIHCVTCRCCRGQDLVASAKQSAELMQSTVAAVPTRHDFFVPLVYCCMRESGGCLCCRDLWGEGRFSGTILGDASETSRLVCCWRGRLEREGLAEGGFWISSAVGATTH